MYFLSQRAVNCSCGATTRRVRSVWGRRATPCRHRKSAWGNQSAGCPVGTTTLPSSQVSTAETGTAWCKEWWSCMCCVKLFCVCVSQWTELCTHLVSVTAANWAWAPTSCLDTESLSWWRASRSPWFRWPVEEDTRWHSQVGTARYASFCWLKVTLQVSCTLIPVFSNRDFCVCLFVFCCFFF